MTTGQLLLQSFYEDQDRAMRLGGLHHSSLSGPPHAGSSPAGNVPTLESTLLTTALLCHHSSWWQETRMLALPWTLCEMCFRVCTPTTGLAQQPFDANCVTGCSS